MSWSDYFPILEVDKSFPKLGADGTLEVYDGNLFFDVDSIVNNQKGDHLVVFSIFYNTTHFDALQAPVIKRVLLNKKPFIMLAYIPIGSIILNLLSN